VGAPQLPRPIDRASRATIIPRVRLPLTLGTHGRRIAAVAIAGGAVVLAGCTTHPAPPISAAALQSAHAFNQYRVFWGGTEVDGVRLTDADSPAFFYSPVGFTMYYGNCEGRGALHDGGCTVPLKITTSIYAAHSDASFGAQHWIELHGVPAVVYNGGKNIEVYTDRQEVDIVADSAARAAAAAAALTWFNRSPRAGGPDFLLPYYSPPSETVVTATTAPTGPTGATAAITPPAMLEPAP
jgi:hypothetical protein